MIPYAFKAFILDDTKHFVVKFRDDIAEFISIAKMPLAERIRPKTLDEVVGQAHLLAAGAPLYEILVQKQLPSSLFWGPPGTGKTTIARLLAEAIGAHFVALSAVFSGVADLKKCFEEARQRRQMGQETLLFVDEIHRFNRSQQDSFLPFVEDGSITLVGATTENPSFELNAALLSRCQVWVLHSLAIDDLLQLLQRAENQLGMVLPLDDAGKTLLAELAQGDGRYFLNLVEHALQLTRGKEQISAKELLSLLQRRRPLYDKKQEGHYNLISAYHKSLRASDVDAALYYFARMIDAGEDPNYIARRTIRFASEDVGLADPNALTHALSAWQTFERLGEPEGILALASAVVYCATAPKSNALYLALKRVMPLAQKTGHINPPQHILNAPTELMQSLGYGQNYQYDHDHVQAFSGQNCFPDEIARQAFYEPSGRGFEKELQKRLNYWQELRQSPPNA